jgi:hypothetical protein
MCFLDENTRFLIKIKTITIQQKASLRREPGWVGRVANV